MAAPIWAISLTGPTLSRRAVNEPSSVVGIASSGSGCRWKICSPASRSRPDSKTDLVSSSTNKGTPSVLVMICADISCGKALCPAMSTMMASVCSRPSRSSRSMVTCGSSSHCGKNSGLKLISTSTGAVLMDAMIWLNSSRVLELAQCASASSMTTGAVRASSRICRIKHGDREILLPLRCRTLAPGFRPSGSTTGRQRIGYRPASLHPFQTAPHAASRA